MARHVFQLDIRPDKKEELQQLNERYGPALERAAAGIEGFKGVEKYVVGDVYVEVIDYDGDFADFGKQLAADPEVRDFLRAVNDCFVQSLRDMEDRRMELLQRLGNGSLSSA